MAGGEHGLDLGVIGIERGPERLGGDMGFELARLIRIEGDRFDAEGPLGGGHPVEGGQARFAGGDDDPALGLELPAVGELGEFALPTGSANTG